MATTGLKITFKAAAVEPAGDEPAAKKPRPSAGGGVKASSYGNKMNESKPHRTWAERTQLRARAFGVARPGVSFVELLEASMR